MDRLSHAFNHNILNELFNKDVLARNHLTPAVQSHLTRVYATLTLGLVVAGLGAYFHVLTHLGGFLSLIGGMAALVVLAFNVGSSPLTTQLGLFALFCGFQGMSLGSLIELALMIDPSTIVTALLGTVVVFACFTAATLFSTRRSMLYLGGILSSGISLLMLMSFINIFARSEFMFNMQLYLGLMVFCGYIMFDTEMIIFKNLMGDNAFVWHATELFIDFVAIFVRLLIILLQNSQKKERKRREN